MVIVGDKPAYISHILRNDTGVWIGMQTDWNENHAFLRGEAAAAPVVSHENRGVTYWTFPLRVERLSGTEDRINVVVSAGQLEQCPVAEGAEVEIEGEVRSFNNKSGRGSRLVITLFARSLRPSEGEHANDLSLAGVLCKPPVLRRTPLGRDICDLMLAVNRRYGRADYLPCIVWGSLAQRCAALGVGDGVRLEGRLQSRQYIKVENGQNLTRTAFEVSVMKLEPAGAAGLTEQLWTASP